MNLEQTRKSERGTRNRADRLRALNVPYRVEVELDAGGLPIGMRDAESGIRRSVEAIGEVWRIDDEWWRQPISRRCVEVIFEGGGRVVDTEAGLTVPRSAFRVPLSAFRLLCTSSSTATPPSRFSTVPRSPSSS